MLQLPALVSVCCLPPLLQGKDSSVTPFRRTQLVYSEVKPRSSSCDTSLHGLCPMDSITPEILSTHLQHEFSRIYIPNLSATLTPCCSLCNKASSAMCYKIPVLKSYSVASYYSFHCLKKKNHRKISVQGLNLYHMDEGEVSSISPIYPDAQF